MSALTGAPARLTAYAVGLVAVFLAAFGVGRWTGPDETPEPASAHAADAGHGGDALQPAGAEGAHGAHLPAGLQVAEDGYRLRMLTTALPTGAPEPLRFQVLGPDGAPVTRYTTSHEADLHLIVVRRDLSGFRHLHPTLGADGTWTVPLAVAEPGQYRVLADFQPAGRASGLTLGVDVPAAGDYRPRDLPAPARSVELPGGYTVALDGELVPGASAELVARVSRDGAEVADLQPYLGAYGHLVALRAGDLAYLHVHPAGGPGDGKTAPGPAISFSAEVPSAGEYRLYLQFRHAGSVHTAEFTAVASAGGSTHGEPGHTHG